MEKTRDALVEFIANEAVAEWEGKKLPLYMSAISPRLKEKTGIQYKEIIGLEIPLKAWVRDNAGTKYRFVEHPTNKAGSVVVPVESGFEFELRGSADAASKSFSRRRITLDFLRVLAELDSGDVAKISLPVDVLVKLLRDK